MVFTTHIFVFYFLPAVLLGYYLLPRLLARLGLEAARATPWRNVWLLGMSYVFYGWWNPWFILLMFGVTLVNYLCGLAIAAPGASPHRRRTAVTTAIVLSLATLGVFKYAGFFQVNLNHLLHGLGAAELTVLNLALPVGISFYVFQALSYSVDVYRGEAPPARSLTDFAAYIALFPQLVAGPIVRYQTVAGALVNRSHTVAQFATGAALFILGFAKKVLVANPLGGIADAAFGAQALSAGDAWWGVTAYAFQIYFDFSGYSDMAIGLGRMIGFEFPRNFNAPYRADSITDFWRRWHISLSTFLRDYLYIPLGGNRRGTGRTYVNLALVMLLGGLWHGANWTFVIWGAYHGAWLTLERWRGKAGLGQVLPQPVRILLTFVLVLISWVFFRAATLGEAGAFLGAMLGASPAGIAVDLLPIHLYQRGDLLMMTLAAALVWMPWQAWDWCERLTWPKALVLVPLFGLSLATMFAQAFNPFLYFQF